MRTVLLIGFGNPGRLDDGLGPALADAVEKMNIPGVDVDCDYQPTIEDSVNIADHDVVIFADADVNGPEPFYFKPLEPDEFGGFTSHSVSPSGLIGLTQKLFGKEIEAYVLGIRGYEFDEFGERLSERASKNLAEAIEFIENALHKREFPLVRANETCEKAIPIVN